MSKGVFCYRNLHYKGVVWSIKSNTTGRVLSRSPYVVIRNAELKVSQAGRQRVLKQKRKNVHAGIKGTWVKGAFNCHVADWRGFTGVYNEDGSLCEWVRISYNPYKGESFVRQDTGQAVTRATTVILDEKGAWALDPK